MNGDGRNQILVTHIDEDSYRRVAAPLRSARMDVHRASWDDTTLELVQSTSFDTIVIGFPVTAQELGQFLEIARAEGAACRRAGLVLIADPADSKAAERLLGRGANRIVGSDRLDTDLLDTVLELARAAPRVSLRVPAQIKLFADGRPLRVMAQIENLSTSGMLLRGVTQFPLGTSFEFEIIAPDEGDPIRGTAEITRATDPDHESIEGVGVRFVSFQGADKLRLEDLLGSRLDRRRSVQG
jgi:hypothetical protein